MLSTKMTASTAGNTTTPTPEDFLFMFQSFSNNDSMSGIDEQSPLINFSILPSPVRFSDKLTHPSSTAASSTSISTSSGIKLDVDNGPRRPFLARPMLTSTPSLPKTEESRKRPMLAHRSKNISVSITPTQPKLKPQNVKQEPVNDKLPEQANGGGNEQGEAVETNHPGMPPLPARSEQGNCVDEVVDDGNVSQCDEPLVKTRSIKKNEIRDADILSHRGVASSKRLGNVRFRELVIEYKPAFDANPCLDDRTALAKKIVDQLRPGRFLKLEDSGTYRVVDYQSSVTKALFAMRDCKKKPKKKKTVVIDDLLQHEPLSRKRNIGESYPSTSSKRLRSDDCTLARPRPKRKAVTPPPKAPLPPYITDAENRKIRSLISDSVKNITSSSTVIIPTNTTSRSEEIHAYIETMVKKGFDIRRESADFIDEEWFHPEMQKCIRVQILQRCRIAMNSTGMTHTEFFDRLFRLKIFP